MRVVLVDGSSHFYRAFFAIRGLANSRGMPTNAAYGFTTMLRKVLQSLQPDRIAVVFDAWAPTFRNELYPAYKANRQEMPEDLAVQIPWIKRIPPAYRIFTIEQPGYEADDIIATIATRAAREGAEVLVVTADKDLMQIVTKRASDPGPGILLYDDRSERRIGIDEVVQKFGVPPPLVADVLALMGDSSDNVPGVRGIGPKTAGPLVARFGPVENIYAQLDRVEPARVRALLERGRAQAELSKKLVTVRRDVPIRFTLDDLARREPDEAALREIFTELDFAGLMREAEPAEPRGGTVEYARYRLITDPAEFARAARRYAGADLLAVDVETDSTDTMRARLVGLSLSAGEGDGVYIPLAHSYTGAPAQIPLAEVRRVLGPVLADARVPKTGQNIKFDLVVLRRHGFDLRGIVFDTMLAAYVLDPEAPKSLDHLARKYLGLTTVRYEDVTGRGKSQVTFDRVPVERARDYAAEDAEIAWRLTRALRAEVDREGLSRLLDEIEIPLVEVLATMEMAGVQIDTEALERLSVHMEQRIALLRAQAHRQAGGEFNLDSPKQLREVLFRRLGLRPGRQTKSGFSTDVRELERLAAEHALPRTILEYRALAKLKSTYMDALAKMAHPETGRVHTTYNQAVTATGRLSSSEPNLQNVPVRTEAGRAIRAAIVAPRGRRLVCADYSQIELRVLAHVCGDPGLRQAFAEDRDIHAATASEIFGVPPQEVTPEQRRKAKEVNFGIVYGLGAFGLAQRLGISQTEAQAITDRYFKRFPKVREYRERVLEEARRAGMVRTLLGRRRFVRDVASRNESVRRRAEREAVNTPIQGGAADIMKVAMIRVARALAKEDLDAVPILQVHDELVVECAAGAADTVAEILRSEMESAVRLEVPLKVDVRAGRNWAECK
jgi:DNA polymerase-1